MRAELSHERLEKVRTTLEDDLKNVPEGMHKPIRPDVMEALIFYKLPKFDGKVVSGNIEFSGKEAIERLNSLLSQAKLPIWTGSFLSKVDLSGISFEGAVLDFEEIRRTFNNVEQIYGIEFSKNDMFKYLEKLAKHYHQLPSCGKLIIGGYEYNYRSIIQYYDNFFSNARGYQSSEVIVDFSNTNVVIEPQKLFSAISYEEKSDLEDLFNSNYGWEDDTVEKKSIPRITHCSFANADLKGADWGEVYLKNTDLSNTGVKITVNTSSRDFVDGARSCKLDGCVVNGKLVKGDKISEEEKAKILGEAADLEAQYLNAFNVEPVPKRSR